ncbi:TPA: hypothetical protein JLN09_002092 [Escherichia coli]|uniref:hypothetical protein n=1 Tax=Escherichia coli TaxID=562 RepID=UPI000D158ADB|nr:hypothetical protein [Escherichia coli]PSY64223.1 hypothetical protein C7B18_26235 [Escherichia coli]GDD17145.1 hypothetical protein HmCmsJML254_03984 [Escherichia coli]HAV8880583.1 hypothetical protein [Escherichia coli]HAW1374316.1 hypothetical protein [Escherichia coli]HAW7885781.1 hypothetical protein [Escherichia coli]
MIFKRNILLVSLSLLLSACNSKSLFFGDYYKAGLDNNMCFYQEDSFFHPSKNGTCFFESDTLIGMRSNKESFLVMFSTLASSTGYTAVYDVDRNNVNELSNIFINFVRWSELPPKERARKALLFNNSSASNNEVATRWNLEYKYLTSAPNTMNHNKYKNTPLLKVNNKGASYLGVPQEETWLLTPRQAIKFVSVIKRTSMLLKQ